MKYNIGIRLNDEERTKVAVMKAENLRHAYATYTSLIMDIRNVSRDVFARHRSVCGNFGILSDVYRLPRTHSTRRRHFDVSIS